MGMPEKAAEQSAQFATKKVDPGAPTYSLEFLLKHPEISTESVPWHIHTDMSPEFSAEQPQGGTQANGKSVAGKSPNGKPADSKAGEKK